MTSQRSAFIIRPSPETTERRNLSRSIVKGRSSARRSMIASRASCILILRSSESDCAVVVDILSDGLWPRERGACDFPDSCAPPPYLRERKRECNAHTPCLICTDDSEPHKELQIRKAKGERRKAKAEDEKHAFHLPLPSSIHF